MNLLLDTHVIIWFITDDKKLPPKIKTIIENPENAAFVSMVSLWEMGIKHSLQKLTLTKELKDVFKLIEDSGFEIMPVTTEHILENSKLPFHHRDPFDRMLIAQANAEDLKLVSKDDWMKNYQVDVIW